MVQKLMPDGQFHDLSREEFIQALIEESDRNIRQAFFQMTAFNVYLIFVLAVIVVLLYLGVDVTA